MQAGLILWDIFCVILVSYDLKIWTAFLNSYVNFQFNAIWHRRSAAALIFCTRLAECDITITPSVTWMDLLHWWYNHTAHVVSSSRSLAFLDNMTEKHKSTSPSAIQVEYLRKTISSEDKLD